jgi:hypothetical protein
MAVLIRGLLDIEVMKAELDSELSSSIVSSINAD